MGPAQLPQGQRDGSGGGPGQRRLDAHPRLRIRGCVWACGGRDHVPPGGRGPAGRLPSPPSHPAPAPPPPQAPRQGVPRCCCTGARRSRATTPRCCPLATRTGTARACGGTGPARRRCGGTGARGGVRGRAVEAVGAERRRPFVCASPPCTLHSCTTVTQLLHLHPHMPSHPTPPFRCTTRPASTATRRRCSTWALCTSTARACPRTTIWPSASTTGGVGAWARGRGQGSGERSGARTAWRGVVRAQWPGVQAGPSSADWEARPSTPPRPARRRPRPPQRAQGAARRALCGAAGAALPGAARLVGGRAGACAAQAGRRRQRAALHHAGCGGGLGSGSTTGLGCVSMHTRERWPVLSAPSLPPPSCRARHGGRGRRGAPLQP